jgi:hypothetical protein
MALEPLVQTAADAPDPELRDMTRRMRVAAVLSAPLLVIAMAGVADDTVMVWMQAALATRWSSGPGRRSSIAVGSRCETAASTCFR